MGIVSTTELQTLSNWCASNLLSDTCAVQREVNSVWTTVSGMNAIPCELITLATEGTITDETTGAVTMLVLMPRNTDVHSPDRLVINGINYRVLDIEDPGTYEILRRVQVVRFPTRGAVS